MATRKEIENCQLGNSADLCKLAETLEYRGFVDQLQLKNGAYASSLLAFFDDNPGAIEAVTDWVLDNLAEDDEDEEFEDDEDET